MNKTIAIIATLFIAATLASCYRTSAEANHSLKARLWQKDQQVSKLKAELGRKTLEADQLKAGIAKRDKQIGRLSESLLFTTGENIDLRDKVKALSELNMKQKKELDAKLEQLKAIQQDLRKANYERNKWVDKFYTQEQNHIQIIKVKEGIIQRQKTAIEEQNEMMAKYIRKTDIARSCCAKSSPIILELPAD